MSLSGPLLHISSQSTRTHAYTKSMFPDLIWISMPRHPTASPNHIQHILCQARSRWIHMIFHSMYLARLSDLPSNSKFGLGHTSYTSVQQAYANLTSFYLSHIQHLDQINTLILFCPRVICPYRYRTDK